MGNSIVGQLKFNALPPDIQKEPPEKIAQFEQAREAARKRLPDATPAELDDQARLLSGAGSQLIFRMSGQGARLGTGLGRDFSGPQFFASNSHTEFASDAIDPTAPDYAPVPSYLDDPSFVITMEDFDLSEGNAQHKQDAYVAYFQARLLKETGELTGLLASGARIFERPILGAGSKLEEYGDLLIKRATTWARNDVGPYVFDQEVYERFSFERLDSIFSGELRAARTDLQRTLGKRESYLAHEYPASVQRRQDAADITVDVNFLAQSDAMFADIDDMARVSAYVSAAVDVTHSRVEASYATKFPTSGADYLKLQEDYGAEPWKRLSREAGGASEQIFRWADGVRPSVALPPIAERAAYLEDLTLARAHIQEIYFKQTLPTFQRLITQWSANGQSK